MATTPAPPPVHPDAFKRRFDAGARTMRELDPAFAKWVDQNERLNKFQGVAILIGVSCLLGTLIIAGINSL